jgi:hypothetical protein
MRREHVDRCDSDSRSGQHKAKRRTFYLRWHKEIGLCFKRQAMQAKIHRSLLASALPVLSAFVALCVVTLTAKLVLWLMQDWGEVTAGLFGRDGFRPSRVSFLVAAFLTAFLLFKGVPTARRQIKENSGARRAGHIAGWSIVAAWWPVMLFIFLTAGAYTGMLCVFGSMLWLLEFGAVALEFGVVVGISKAWALATKSVGLRWPKTWKLINAALLVFSVKCAHLAFVGFKWLLPSRIEYMLDHFATFVVPLAEKYFQACSITALALPVVVEALILRGLKQHGPDFRRGDYYRRWCLRQVEPPPSYREQLHEVRNKWHNGPQDRDKDPDIDFRQVKDACRKAFADVFQVGRPGPA